MISRISDRMPDFGPVTAALLLALVAIGPVAWSLLIEPPLDRISNEDNVLEPIAWQPMAPIEALVLATAVVVPTALIAGWLGGRIWRRYRFLGVFVALAVAWALGIVLLPIVAGLLGIPLQSGIFCLFGCTAYLRAGEPLSGVIAYGQLVFAGVLTGEAFLIPAFFFWLFRRDGQFVVPVLAIVVAHAIVHWVALLSTTTGGQIPYACLTIGVVMWALWMRRSTVVVADDPAVVMPPIGIDT